MKDSNETQQDTVDSEIDGVLSGAAPRPAPHSGRKEEIYGELRGEWLANVSAEQRSRRYVILGVAASIIATVALTLQMNLGSVDSLSPPDAVLVRSMGSGTTVNGRPIDERTPINAPLQFVQGDELATGPDAAVAIVWNTVGSLRVSSASTVVFASNERLELVEGDIYFDSKPHDLSASSSIVVDTPYGRIHHVGTQFVASVASNGVNISVREGEVTYGDGADRVLVSAGQSAFIDESLTATFAPITATDETWSWASRIAPHLNVDGRTTREIIEWLSRETGRVVEYESAAAEEYAGRDTIRGIGQVGPVRAMSIVPFASDLRFKIDQDSITVELKDQ